MSEDSSLLFNNIAVHVKLFSFDDNLGKILSFKRGLGKGVIIIWEFILVLRYKLTC